MVAYRFFLPTALSPGEITLQGDEMRHAKVMRIEVASEIELINGKGDLATASVTHLDKRSLTATIHHIQHFEEPTPPLILAQALPRSTRLTPILEKGTELGATHFWLFPGERSEKKEVTENQIERMDSLVLAAMKQCGRLYKPQITVKPSLGHWSSVPYCSFFGEVSSTAPTLHELLQRENLHSGCLFFVGPEAGFSKKEERQLKKLGARGVKLHKNILRTDTAGLVALSVIDQWL